MIDKFTHSPVFPIVPCYNDNSWIDYLACMVYIKYLKENGAQILMTTAGTSQFDLLTNKQIRGLNQALTDNIDDDTTIIIGLKPQSTDAIIAEMANYASMHRLSIKDGDAFFLLKYPERFYDRETIVRYFHDVADESDLPCLIHCSPIISGYSGKFIDYTAEAINDICRHDNIVGIKEEHSSITMATEVVEALSADMGVIFAGGSQRRYRALGMYHKNSTFLTGIGSMFPKLDIEMNERAENECFNIFFKHGWHPSLRYALQYLKLVPEYARQPWPELPNVAQKEIENVVNEIKELI